MLNKIIDKIVLIIHFQIFYDVSLEHHKKIFEKFYKFEIVFRQACT